MLPTIHLGNDKDMGTEFVTVDIRALIYGEGCIGEVCDDSGTRSGKRAIVPHTVPGEKITASIVKEQARLINANLHQIITTSADRILAPCPVYNDCGGCNLQHMSFVRQQQEKVAMVAGMLKHNAGIVPDEPVRLAAGQLPEFAYRSRVTLHMNSKAELGFYKQNSAEVVEFSRCLIASDIINESLAKLKPILKRVSSLIDTVTIEEMGETVSLVVNLKRWPVSPEASIDTLFKDLAAQFKESVIRYKKKTLADYRSKQALQSGHFSQVNRAANELLKKLVQSKIIANDTQITELYAGAGNLTIPLAQTGAAVRAVEVDKVLVAFGKQLAQKSGCLDRITFHCNTAEKYVAYQRLSKCVVIDPPRSGAAEVVVACVASKVEKIIYISCSLPTLCRDLKTLESGGYRLATVEVVDMFPQTHHVELVCVVYLPP